MVCTSMPGSDWNRRDVLRTLSSVAIGLAESRQSHAAEAGQVKWSAGIARPKLVAPAGATDCHHHVYDARFPAAPNAVLLPPDASVDDYRALQRRLGTSRSVIVQPSTYGTDNRCTLAALAALGRSSRAVAVVDDTVADAELKRLDGLGVRGIRFNLAQAGATTPAMIEPLAKRIAPFGWHLQIERPAAVLFDLMPIFERVRSARLQSPRARPAGRRREPSALPESPRASRSRAHVDQAVRCLHRLQVRSARPTRTRAQSPAPTWRRRPSGSSGEATGPIRPSRRREPDDAVPVRFAQRLGPGCGPAAANSRVQPSRAVRLLASRPKKKSRRVFRTGPCVARVFSRALEYARRGVLRALALLRAL